MISHKLGTIPQKVTYFWSRTLKVSPTFEDDAEDGEAIIELDVLPTFPAPADNKKRCTTGKKWATDIAKSSWRMYKGTKKVQETVHDNTPKKYRIVDLEHRSRGGRAYKVVDENNHYFDFREDILLDSLVNANVKKGWLSGDYIWAVVGSEMKLIRVGSHLHKKMETATKRGKLKKLGTDALQAGGLYQGKKAEPRLLLAFVSIPGEKKPYMLWFEPYKWELEKGVSPVALLKKQLKEKEYHRIYYTSVTKSHSMIEELGVFKGVPPKIIEMFRKSYHKTLREELKRGQASLKKAEALVVPAHDNIKSGDYLRNYHQRNKDRAIEQAKKMIKDAIKNYSVGATMHLPGTKAPKVKELGAV